MRSVREPSNTETSQSRSEQEPSSVSYSSSSAASESPSSKHKLAEQKSSATIEAYKIYHELYDTSKKFCARLKKYHAAFDQFVSKLSNEKQAYFQVYSQQFKKITDAFETAEFKHFKELSPETHATEFERITNSVIAYYNNKLFAQNLIAHTYCIGSQEKIASLLTAEDRKNWASMLAATKLEDISIDSLLIEPVQYMPRYELLTKEIIHRSKKVEDFDIQTIQFFEEKLAMIQNQGKNTNENWIYLVPIYNVIAVKANALAASKKPEKKAKHAHLQSYLTEIETAIQKSQIIDLDYFINRLLADEAVTKTSGKIKSESSVVSELKQVQAQNKKNRQMQQLSFANKLKEENRELQQTIRELTAQIETAKQSVDVSLQEKSQLTAQLQASEQALASLQQQLEALRHQLLGMEEKQKAKAVAEKEAQSAANAAIQSLTADKRQLQQQVAVLQEQIAHVEKQPAVEVKAHASVPAQDAVPNPLAEENARLREQVARQNAIIENHANAVIQPQKKSNWLTWLAVGMTLAIGVGLIATGIGALPGVGLLVGLGYVLPSVLIGAGVVITAQSAQQANLAYASNHPVKQAVQIEKVAVNEPAIQHIGHLLNQHQASPVANAAPVVAAVVDVAPVAANADAGNAPVVEAASSVAAPQPAGQSPKAGSSILGFMSEVNLQAAPKADVAAADNSPRRAP